jgi:6-phosphofructokinase
LLASTLGAVSVHALLAGVKEGMVGVQGRQVQITSFKKVAGKASELPRELLDVAKNLAV